MSLKSSDQVGASQDLLDAIAAFPVEREVEHCGVQFKVSPFDFYADCPRCGARLKLRAFSGAVEIEDVFDAVFEWLRHPEARLIAERRQKALASDDDD